MFVGNSKVSALIRYTTTEQRGVSRIKDSNVCVRHRLALFVNDGARQVSVGLVGALHEDLLCISVVLVNGHANRIEAYHLLDGIGQRLTADGGGDAEVLQFVIEEHDGVVCLQFGELTEGIGE